MNGILMDNHHLQAAIKLKEMVAKHLKDQGVEPADFCRSMMKLGTISMVKHTEMKLLKEAVQSKDRAMFVIMGMTFGYLLMQMMIDGENVNVIVNDDTRNESRNN